MARSPERDAAVAGALAMAAAAAVLAFDPSGSVSQLRERVFDRLLALTAPVAGQTVVVIDIDADSLTKVGPWPWRRERVARLIEAARAAGAAAVGVDILYAEPESVSPAALARRLAAATGDARARALSASLIDDDRRLMDALTPGRVALGFALGGEGGDAPATPVLTRGEVDLGQIWSAAGGVYPAAPLQAPLGALSLPGDADGVVRRAPLFVATGGVLRPGLALETLRLARGASVYLLDASRGTSGDVSVALPRDAMLRLAPGGAAMPTVSAADVLERGFTAPLASAIAFIGVSAPEAGGLRATADDPLTPSVLIQARAARQIASGFAPIALDPRGFWLAVLVFGAGLIALAALGARVAAAAAAVGGLAALAGAAVWAASAARLFDPVEAAWPALAGYAAAAAVMASAAHRRARRLRARFERHLAPQVIARIVADEGAAKLKGERREITALFSDIEGFTGLVARAGPEALVRVLDGYFEGVITLVLAHGGMIDKFVGDAAHVFFNMPLDLADHATKALDCAIEIVRWTEAYRREAGPAALALGRTRIGLESGPAIVGDVGGDSKLDYTAHGETVNAAARLEPANKLLGSTICIGPGAAARIDRARLRPVGLVELRGFDARVLAAAPWPEGASAEWRGRYLEAFALREAAPAEAARAFAALASDIDDPVALRLAGGD